jgi:hypothetical protein
MGTCKSRSATAWCGDDSLFSVLNQRDIARSKGSQTSSRSRHLTSRGPNLVTLSKMNVGRTIFAVLIAFSVAVLPAAGLVSDAAMKSTETADMSAMDDMDCCQHQANPCDKAMDGCSCMATCVLKCFTFFSTASVAIVFPARLASLSPAFETDRFSSQTGSPPFRPPRV